jgi:hypothetical protein
MNLVNQIQLTVLLFLLNVLMLTSMIKPNEFGKWLQIIDNARYEYLISE